jgi:hypothetical protein
MLDPPAHAAIAHDVDAVPQLRAPQKGQQFAKETDARDVTVEDAAAAAAAAAKEQEEEEGLTVYQRWERAYARLLPNLSEADIAAFAEQIG